MAILTAMASNLVAMASILIGMASILIAMASNLTAILKILTVGWRRGRALKLYYMHQPTSNYVGVMTTSAMMAASMGHSSLRQDVNSAEASASTVPVCSNMSGLRLPRLQHPSSNLFLSGTFDQKSEAGCLRQA